MRNRLYELFACVTPEMRDMGKGTDVIDEAIIIPTDKSLEMSLESPKNEQKFTFKSDAVRTFNQTGITPSKTFFVAF